MTLLTPAETAQFLKVSMRTLRRLPVPRAKIGGQLRYDLADLEAWVRMQKQGGAQMLVVPTGTATINGVTVSVPPAQVPLQMLESTIIPKPISGSSQPRPVKHRNPLFAIGGKR
ncbi:MAG: helix-turn-helix domain-containing protein [Nitrospira sp.]|nr:helix-turn-helix domain-containing protein [Nitrospira sp.]